VNKRTLEVLGILFLAAPATCSAQVRSDDYRGHGYFYYVTPGGLTEGSITGGAIGLGAGGELMLYKGFATGVDLGFLEPTSGFGNGILLASFNGAYHFLSSTHERRFVPFVTAGYTRFSIRPGAGANVANYGAGIQYWFKPRWAFRVEGRDHVNTSGPAARAWQVRFAIVFR
jgi:hypothetical protein